MTRRTNLLSAASMTTTEKLRRAQDLMRSIERSTKIKSNSTLADELVSLRLDLETIHNLDLIDIAGRWKVKKLVYGRPVDALINYWKNLKRPQKVQRTLKRKAPAAKVSQPQEAKKVKNEPKRKEFCVPVTTPSEPEIVPNQKFIIPKTVSEISNLLRGSWDVEINTNGVSVLKYKGLIDEEIAIEFIRKCVALKPLKVEDEMSPRSIPVARRQAPTSKKEPSQGELTRQALEEIGMVISKPSATVSHQPEIPKLVDLNDELDVSDSSDDEGELDELLLREMKNLESGKSSSEESDSVEDEFDDEDDFLQDLLIKQLGQSTEKVGKSGSSTSHCHSDDLFDEIL
ncbi:hypothetical protein L596_014260 [Steinernema carpocapsae]|uniref:Uncharacterized protein n=1 Tax=Steinernema carpocapsae TaxID=34508 RepID=A0A4U5NBD1_STECR|nr:hypothetical protein L596_014260 [Steinernema carpocapsae]